MDLHEPPLPRVTGDSARRVPEPSLMPEDRDEHTDAGGTSIAVPVARQLPAMQAPVRVVRGVPPILGHRCSPWSVRRGASGASPSQGHGSSRLGEVGRSRMSRAPPACRGHRSHHRRLRGARVWRTDVGVPRLHRDGVGPDDRQGSGGRGTPRGAGQGLPCGGRAPVVRCHHCRPGVHHRGGPGGR